ncbi:MAG: iron-containing alcohol dehydrogenase [Alphaproteobacteria bacterium]|jgi:alcohol dehydrogenase class IV|nr:4-hydroxybutyrate dehydrogenase [Rhodospirillaceae bacterium]MDP6406977.1 iron-containing alcohol dehydrogenase [Alphaproteobacteria bacterium]MDP6621091.1 iron-containing alcohol dehydrogenase [Alphaproteobacteria bacterium]
MALINYLTRIQFDFGALGMLAEELKELNVTRPLVVTDEGIVAAGVLDKVREKLPSAIWSAVFDQTPANPTEAAVKQALEVYQNQECDGIVAVGGGSPIDLAKGVALLATHPEPLSQYAFILGGAPRITVPSAPLAAVPTTAGTGSEVGRAALLTLDDGRKLGFIGPHIIPDVAICDPELTLGLPPYLTAATGMDALTHCIEVFLSPRINPPADAIALDGAGRAMRNIERATTEGSDRDARWQMMMASLQGGMGFQKGLGAVHAMSHPLGGLAEPVLHHGTLNAVILPAVLRFNADSCDDKYQRLAAAMNLSPETDLASTIEDLNRRLGLPASLREIGVSDDVVPGMVEGALADHSNATNPRPTSTEDYQALFAAAMG